MTNQRFPYEPIDWSLGIAMKLEQREEATGVPVAFYLTDFYFSEDKKVSRSHHIVLSKIEEVVEYPEENKESNVFIYYSSGRELKLFGNAAKDFMGYWQQYISY